MIPAVPNVPIKKSLEVLELYQEFGPKFGKVLYSLYQDVKAGDCDNLDKRFTQLCYDHILIGPDIPIYYKQPSPLFPFINQKNYLGEPFGYPICISVNNEVAHGNPLMHEIKSGDIVSIDCGVAIPFESYCINFDAAFTTIVGEPDSWTTTPWKALRNIALANPKDTASIAEIIHKTAFEENLGQVVSLTGHGIGFKLHEAPVIHNAPGKFLSVDLFDGLCFCAEPIFTNLSLSKQNPLFTPVHLGDDGWTVLTTNGSLSSHFETTFGVIDGQIIDLIGVTGWDL